MKRRTRRLRVAQPLDRAQVERLLKQVQVLFDGMLDSARGPRDYSILHAFAHISHEGYERFLASGGVLVAPEWAFKSGPRKADEGPVPLVPVGCLALLALVGNELRVCSVWEPPAINSTGGDS